MRGVHGHLFKSFKIPRMLLNSRTQKITHPFCTSQIVSTPNARDDVDDDYSCMKRRVHRVTWSTLSQPLSWRGSHILSSFIIDKKWKMEVDIYKLTYFDLRGIAEPIRLIFKYANVPFEDNRVVPETWKEVKHTFKWHQLPNLEYNGKLLTQSVAISRFLASKFNLKPTGMETEWADAKCDEIVGAINDLRLQIKSLVLSKMGVGTQEDSALLRNNLLTSTVPRFLENLSDILIQLRKDGDVDDSGNFIFGKKPTWPDFWLAHFTHQWSEVLEKPHLLDDYELLKKQQEDLYNLPGVAEWIKERPNSFI